MIDQSNTAQAATSTKAAFSRVLITGGNGNLGRLTAEQLLDLGIEVVKFDIPGTEPLTTRDGETVVTGDIRDQALVRSLFERFQPDAVVHFASLLSGSSAADPSAAWEIRPHARGHPAMAQ